MSARRERWAAALAVTALVGLSGCSGDAPTAAVTRRGGRVVVRYKPCRAGERIDRLDLLGGPSAGGVVWSARLRPGATAALEMTVGLPVPGYAVVDRLGALGVRPGVGYSFDARSTAGRAWGGPGVRLDRLTEGRVRVAGQDLAFADWAGRPASCPRVSVVSAGIAGLAVAAVAAALMWLVRGPLRALARRSRR